jgi:xylulokinase
MAADPADDKCAVDTAQTDEGAAHGAAILAAVGIGLWPTVDAACDALVRSAGVTAPQPEVVALMNERYDAYRRIYPALRDIMHGDERNVHD